MLEFSIFMNIVQLIAIVVLVVLLRRMISKTDLYETTITNFYSDVALTLHTMRLLDEKKMFESDDEVGELFSQLVDVLSMLRPILYGLENDEKTEN